MVDSEIRVNDCKHLEFGNPSSHSFASSFIYLTTAYLFVKHLSVKTNIKKYAIWLMILMNLILSGIYMIAFSRVVKGVHSYN